MSAIRVLICSHSAGLLGAERSLLEIASGLRSEGHVVLVSAPRNGELESHLKSIGVEFAVVPTSSWMGPRHHIFPLGGLRLLQAKRSADAYVELIRRFDPDVVVTNTAILPAPALAAERTGKPHIWIVRESLGANPQLRSAKRWRSIVDSIFSQSVAVCTISAYVDDCLIRLGASPGKTWRVTPNPTGFAPSESSPARTDGLTLLAPGFLSLEKGQHLAILALWAALKRDHASRPSLHLRVAGRGRSTYERFLRLLVRVLQIDSRVTFLGWLPDLSAEYANANYVVVTSRNEAYGRVYVESIRCGRPVIGFDAGAAREALGIAGTRIVPSGDWRALSGEYTRVQTLTPSEHQREAEIVAARALELASSPSQYEMFRSVLVGLGYLPSEANS